MSDTQEQPPTPQDISEATERLVDASRIGFAGPSDVMIQVITPKDPKRPGSKILWAAVDILEARTPKGEATFLDAGQHHGISAFKMPGSTWVALVEQLTGNKPDLGAIKQKLGM